MESENLLALGFWSLGELYIPLFSCYALVIEALFPSTLAARDSCLCRCLKAQVPDVVL